VEGRVHGGGALELMAFGLVGLFGGRHV
jgi:hypothetical protein